MSLERIHPMLKRSILCSLLATLAISVTSSSAFATEHLQVPVRLDVQEAPKAVTQLPSYILEPPDIITVEAIHLVPKDPDQQGDSQPQPPIAMPFAVYSPDQWRNVQHIAGNHTIGPDGFITLGPHGRVYVNGLTLDECRDAIEFHLSKNFENPKVAVEIWAYNSKWYYVIFKSAAIGERIIKFPCTGNEKVSDAIAEIGGFPPNTLQRMWVERPVRNSEKPMILPVDWTDITTLGNAAKPDTNYELFPGDRIVVEINNRATVQERRFQPFGGAFARSAESIRGFWGRR